LTWAAPIIRLFAALDRRHAIKRILTGLPARLRQDYGHAGPYTPEQVQASVRRHGIVAEHHIPYAVAIFSDRKGLKRLNLADPQGPDYEALRAEVGAVWFSADPDFTPRDLARFEAAHADHGVSHSDASGHHSDSFGDGDDGGGGHH